MAEFIKLNWKYLLGATFLHVLFAGLFALTMIQMARNAPPPQLAIQAVVIDATQVGATSRQREREREQERQRIQQEREQVAIEQKRLEEQREVEQRAEQERQVEQQRRQEEEKTRAAEQQLTIQRQEAERKRQAEIEQQQRVEAERQRVAEIQRKQKEEAERRKAAEDARLQKARETELQRQLAEEEGLMQARSSSAFNEYVALIQDQIERNWNRPPSARPGLQCNIRVAQSPNGVVLSAQVEQCNGDAAVKQSIEQAVLRASPLPLPSDRRLFERNLILVFKPSE